MKCIQVLVLVCGMTLASNDWGNDEDLISKLKSFEEWMALAASNDFLVVGFLNNINDDIYTELEVFAAAASSSSVFSNMAVAVVECGNMVDDEQEGTPNAAQRLCKRLNIEHTPQVRVWDSFEEEHTITHITGGQLLAFIRSLKPPAVREFFDEEDLQEFLNEAKRDREAVLVQLSTISAQQKGHDFSNEPINLISGLHDEDVVQNFQFGLIVNHGLVPGASKFDHSKHLFVISKCFEVKSFLTCFQANENVARKECCWFTAALGAPQAMSKEHLLRALDWLSDRSLPVLSELTLTSESRAKALGLNIVVLRIEKTRNTRVHDEITRFKALADETSFGCGNRDIILTDGHKCRRKFAFLYFVYEGRTRRPNYRLHFFDIDFSIRYDMYDTKELAQKGYSLNESEIRDFIEVFDEDRDSLVPTEMYDSSNFCILFEMRKPMSLGAALVPYETLADLPLQVDVLIVGAGPAGIGIAKALHTANVENVYILEQGSIGESFRNFPRETELLTPSFYSNQF
eukprot:m.67423 g.67423  ORF g.67423 m.67423 type:complete len:516 (+) comp11887_c0_seq3:111-1658(+)